VSIWKTRTEREEEEGKGGVAYLDEKSAVVRRERCEDILEDFAESGAVDACHTWREPGFANSPALDTQMDPRATYGRELLIPPYPVHRERKTRRQTFDIAVYILRPEGGHKR
jgi:hypothetical protein